uniref:Dickkopf n=1 Tax=Ciona intestinalis TaxID=7719 RepID=Q4H3Q3_CIOIN|nr:dickkopf protein precursor [Ciona intestinalis]BAE06374.1 dickkopf [Ciona intestinalis]
MLLSKVVAVYVLWVNCCVLEAESTSHGNDLALPSHVSQIKHGQVSGGSISYRCAGNRPGQCGPYNRKQRNHNKIEKRKRRACKKRENKCKRNKIRKCHRSRKCRSHAVKRCRRLKRRCMNNRPLVENPPPKNPNDKPASTPTIIPKREKEKCNNTYECADGFCCAQHGLVKRCKPFLRIGHICPRPRQHHKRSPDSYERCDCEAGLACLASTNRHHKCQRTSLIT